MNITKFNHIYQNVFNLVSIDDTYASIVNTIKVVNALCIDKDGHSDLDDVQRWDLFEVILTPFRGVNGTMENAVKQSALDYKDAYGWSEATQNTWFKKLHALLDDEHIINASF